MIVALALSIALGGAVWPFGAGRDADATIGSLSRQPPVVDATQPVPDGTGRAREHYEEFLTLAGTPEDMRAESMRRLADLHLAAGEDADLLGDAAASEREYRRAIALYRQYLDEFPGRARADAVLYALARAYESVGETEQSLLVLDALLGAHPASPLAAEAQFRRGERLFMARDWAGAERAYADVVARGADGEFYEQALYKQGWALFKQGFYEECLDPFLEVVGRRLARVQDEDARRPLDGLPTAERELADDSLRAMSLAVSQLDGIASIDALLDRRGTPLAYADVIYAGLGDLYIGQERYGDAADAYRGFVRRQPAHARAPYLQADAIRAFTLGKFPSRVLEARAEFVELYGLHADYWRETTPAARPRVIAELKESLGELASYDHARAQQTREPQAYRQAALWYRRYLEYFPEDAESAQRNFLLAEILYESGDFAAAALEYRRTAYDYGAHAQAAEAGYAALLAGREYGKRLGAADGDAWRSEYIEEQLRFAASFPEHAQAVAVQTNVAEELFGRGATERAIEVAAAVTQREPPAPVEFERVAWTVLAHGQFDLGRYAEAERAYLRLRDFGATDAAQRSQIEERIAAAVYRQAEAHRAAGDDAAAVADFLRVAEAAPEASIRPNAIYDAAALLVAGEQWHDAVPVLQRFRREFPGHEFNADVTQQLALALEAAGQGVQAAAEFETVAATPGLGSDLQREALWRAAGLYQRDGRRADAARVYAGIVTRFPQPFGEAIEARAELAELSRADGDGTARRHWLQDIIAADAAAGAERSDRSRTLAAHAALELATPLRDAFAEVRLSAPLAQSLKTKKQRMELALAAYGKAAEYAVAEVTTAATYETAELYYRLGHDLLDSEKPRNLDADALEEYTLLLEEQAFPFEEKAIELHAVNAERAAEGVYDEWVRRSFARLAEMSPARYARSERSERYVAGID